MPKTLILSLLLVVASGLLAFRYGQLHKQLTAKITPPITKIAEQTPIPPPDETENWETYKNPNLGFSIIDNTYH